jgi:hypothetical protein
MIRVSGRSFFVVVTHKGTHTHKRNTENERPTTVQNTMPAPKGHDDDSERDRNAMSYDISLGAHAS